MSQKTTTTEDEPPWEERAKCRGMPPSLFVPSTPGGSLTKVVNICWGRNDIWGEDEEGQPILLHKDHECPVRLQCRQAGEERNELGVWGGEIRSTRVHLQGRHNGTIHGYEDIDDEPREIASVKFLKDGRPKKSEPTKPSSGRAYPGDS